MESNSKLILTVSCCVVFLVSTSFSSEPLKDEKKVLELKVFNSNGENMIRAEGDPTTTTTEAPTVPIEANTTSSEECDRTGGCCYQYTWPGRRYDNGDTNFTCASYAKASGSKEPCKLPIVFTYQNTTKGGRPNITDLVRFTDENNYKIYCKTTASCIKYTYYTNTNDGKVLWNETRLCGVVTSANKGTTVQKGCYTEKVGGFSREVCVCNTDRCNNTPTLFAPHIMTLVLLAGILMLLQLRNY